MTGLMACTPDMKPLYKTWLCRLVGICSSISGSMSLSFDDGDSPGEKSSEFWSHSPRRGRPPICVPWPSNNESPGVLAVESAIPSSTGLSAADVT